MKFSEAVYEIVKRIPKGRVSTYSEVARATGNPKAARAVGQVLRKNRNPEIPCHRVVLSSGVIGGYRGKQNSREKEKLLRQEGIEIKNNRIMFEKHLFAFSKTKKKKD